MPYQLRPDGEDRNDGTHRAEDPVDEREFGDPRVGGRWAPSLLAARRMPLIRIYRLAPAMKVETI